MTSREASPMTTSGAVRTAGGFSGAGRRHAGPLTCPWPPHCAAPMHTVRLQHIMAHSQAAAQFSNEGFTVNSRCRRTCWPCWRAEPALGRRWASPSGTWGSMPARCSLAKGPSAAAPARQKQCTVIGNSIFRRCFVHGACSYMGPTMRSAARSTSAAALARQNASAGPRQHSSSLTLGKAAWMSENLATCSAAGPARAASFRAGGHQVLQQRCALARLNPGQSRSPHFCR